MAGSTTMVEWRAIPNLVSLGRIGLIPVLIGAWFLGGSWTALLATTILVLGAASDWLDGWLARRLGQTSEFGAFLDPVADKLLVAAALVLIAVRADQAAITIAVVVILLREITVSALRDWMARAGRAAAVRVSFKGKVKTTTQLIAAGLLCYGLNLDTGGEVIVLGGTILLALAAVLSVTSLVDYGRAVVTPDK